MSEKSKTGTLVLDMECPNCNGRIMGEPVRGAYCSEQCALWDGDLKPNPEPTAGPDDDGEYPLTLDERLDAMGPNVRITDGWHWRVILPGWRRQYCCVDEPTASRAKAFVWRREKTSLGPRYRYIDLKVSKCDCSELTNGNPILNPPDIRPVTDREDAS